MLCPVSANVGLLHDGKAQKDPSTRFFNSLFTSFTFTLLLISSHSINQASIPPNTPISFKMLPTQFFSPKTQFTPLNNTFSSTPLKRLQLYAKPTSQDTSSSSSSQPNNKNPLAAIINIPRTILKQTLKPLGDFGLGHRSVWEGGVGLFLVSGTVLFFVSLVWLRAFQLRSRFRKYVAVFEFSEACGICTGTQVRIRGVTVGNVVRVNPSLESVEAVVEVEDDKTIIPRNSLIEVNQSGLLMETMIDITPRDPIPTPSYGPLDPNCVKEGVIVCDREKLKGYQGVSLDALVGICTRLGQEVEQIGVANAYALAERAADVVEEARPLLLKVQAMAEDVQPMLAEARDSGLLREVESLTKSLSLATEDLRKTHTSIMTPENTELIQKSIYTLVFTLKNIESLSSDILSFTGDEATRKNLKLVIKSLSRLL